MYNKMKKRHDRKNPIVLVGFVVNAYADESTRACSFWTVGPSGGREYYTRGKLDNKKDEK